jgi:putative ABC transport system ATP-binding protein
MVTHNMKQALAFGSRLIMMHRGRIIADIDAAEKETLGVKDLLARFYDTGGDAASDRMLLT